MQNVSVQAPGVASQSMRVDSNQLLSRLPLEDFTLLSAHLVDTVFLPGSVLQEAGQTVARVYFPHSGIISLLGVLPDGSAVDVATIGREGAIGLSAALSSRMGVARAVAQSSVRAACTSVLRLAAVAERSRAIRDMILHHNDTLLAQVHQAAVCHTAHHLQARLCRWLLQARDHLGSDTLIVTQQFLSGLLGAQRTSITIISRLLQAEGIIDVRRGHVRIRDVAALERKACSCYPIIRTLLQDSALEHAPIKPASEGMGAGVKSVSAAHRIP